MPSEGVTFTGEGDADVSHNPTSTGPFASRGQAGPIEFAGNGGEDAGGTISDTSPKGDMPPKGGDVQFTGNGGDDV